MAHLNYTIGGNSNLVSFKSAARVPIDSLKVHFKPIQEGTGDPSPENTRPITGWTGVEARQSGKNLIDEAFLSNPNSYVNVGAYGYYYTEDVKLSPNTKYRFVWSDYDDSKIKTCNLYVSGANQYIISDGAYRQYPQGFTTNDSGIIRFGINHRSGYNNITEALSDIFKYGKLLLQVGTDEISYEPYTGQTIPVEFHGKNLFNKANPRTLDASFTSSSLVITASNLSKCICCNVVGGQTYTISKMLSSRFRIGESADDVPAIGGSLSIDHNPGSSVTSATITTQETTKNLVIWVYYSQSDTTSYEDILASIQLELGSTATAYEPYNNTFYGGYVDIAKGELVQEWVTVTYDGVTTDRKITSDYSNSEHIIGGVVYCKPNGLPDANTNSRYYCDTMPIIGDTHALLSLYPYIRTIQAGTLFLRIYVGAAADHPELDTKQKRIDYVNSYLAEHPTSVTYQLATPITYQLTPTELSTLLSTNNIWSNANDVTEVSYAMHDSAMIRAAKRRMAMAVSNPNFLPSSYRRLTGIIFDTKTYYLFNNFHLQGNDTVRISVSVNKSCNVFGCYSSGSAQDNYSLYATTSNTGKYLRYNGETYKSRWASTDQGQRYDIIITPTGSSGMPPSQDDTWEEKNFVSETELCVGTTAVSASSSKLDGIIYGNFIVDNRLCAVPVERISDGTVGYYEMYTHTFYEPIGTNPEKLGYA